MYLLKQALRQPKCTTTYLYLWPYIFCVNMFYSFKISNKNFWIKNLWITQLKTLENIIVNLPGHRKNK